MKKILTAAVALFLTVNFVQAQSTQDQKATKSATTKTPAAKCDMKNCCMMKSGKMVCIKDGKEMSMNEDMKMSDGTLVMKDGTCMTADGKKMMLKNGECIDMSGKSCMMAQPTKEKAPEKANPDQAK